MVGESIELIYHTTRGELSVFSIIRHPLPMSVWTGCARLRSFGLFHHRAPQKEQVPGTFQALEGGIQVIRRIVRWSNNVAGGVDDRRKTLT